MLSRALGNLVANCIQYGGGDAVRIDLREQDLECIFSVRDAEVPVAQGLRQVAFTAEGQVAAKTNGGGRYSRGLGLFAATIAAEAAGARVEASEEDGHNVFMLSVPLD
jgi:K+-sensing histidine kinase KdpD